MYGYSEDGRCCRLSISLLASCILVHRQTGTSHPLPDNYSQHTAVPAVKRALLTLPSAFPGARELNVQEGWDGMACDVEMTVQVGKKRESSLTKLTVITQDNGLFDLCGRSHQFTRRCSVRCKPERYRLRRHGILNSLMCVM